jgi:hypothetical protein
VLQILRRGDWRNFRDFTAQPLSRRSTFSYFLSASWRGRREFRVKWPKADYDHETNVSESLRIKTHS